MIGATASFDVGTAIQQEEELIREAEAVVERAYARAAAAQTDTARRVRLAGYLARNTESWAWGIISATVSGVVAHLFGLPVVAVALLTVLGAGLGAIGFIDAQTKLILNRHTLMLAAVMLGSLSALQVAGWPDLVLPIAAATAAGAFAVMLVLWWFTGFASGGDIKLAPVVAAALSFISPMTAPIWLLVSFVLCMGVIIVRLIRSHGKPIRSVPMGPLMAVAAPASVALSYWLYAALALPLNFG
jgi:hypothetical protein